MKNISIRQLSSGFLVSVIGTNLQPSSAVMQPPMAPQPAPSLNEYGFSTAEELAKFILSEYE